MINVKIKVGASLHKTYISFITDFEKKFGV